jgi:low affinity Fe/Cu permease
LTTIIIIIILIFIQNGTFVQIFKIKIKTLSREKSSPNVSLQITFVAYEKTL